MATELRQPSDLQRGSRAPAPRPGPFALSGSESVLLALPGGVGILLALLGFLGTAPGYSAAVSALSSGFGLMLGARFFATAARRSDLSQATSARSGGGFAAQIVFGLLGALLALLGLANLGFGLIPFGVVASGIGLWAGARALVAALLSTPLGSGPGRKSPPGLAITSAALGFVAGLLGILGLLGLHPLLLTLGGDLALGLGLVAMAWAGARGASPATRS